MQSPDYNIHTVKYVSCKSDLSVLMCPPHHCSGQAACMYGYVTVKIKCFFLTINTVFVKMWIIRLTKKRKKSLDMLPQKEAFHKKDIQRRPPDVGLNVLLQQEDMSATLQRSLFSVNRVFHLGMGSNAIAKLRCVQTTHWFFWASRSQVLHPRFSTNEEGGIRRSTVKVISWIKSRQHMEITLHHCERLLEVYW